MLRHVRSIPTQRVLQRSSPVRPAAALGCLAARYTTLRPVATARPNAIATRNAINTPHYNSVRKFSALPQHVVLTMPALSPTMEQGNIASWNKKEGDEVNAGEVLAEVETDKATVAFESVDDGFIAKVLVPAGTQNVKVNTPVAILVENQADVAAFKNYSGDAAAAAPAAPAPPKAAAAPAAPKASSPAPPAAATQAPAAPAPAASGERVIATPRARMEAAAKGLDLSQVAGTGPARRIIAADVREATPGKAAVAVQGAAPAAAAPAAAAAAPKAAPVAVGGEEGMFKDIPHSQVRKITAQRLTQSKTTIPHYYLSVDVRMDNVLKLRAQLNKQQEKLKEGGVKVSVNDFVIKAAAIACRKNPEANSAWMDNAVRQYNYVDVSVAVSTPGGLITPIVKDADLKGIGQISQDVKELAGRARENKLKPEEFIGGTITISNLGMFGVKSFSAIINPPQACILAVGTTETRVIVNEKKGDGAEPFTMGQFMNVTLSCDHRVIDGAVGAGWLATFKGLLEDPLTMLL